MSLLCSKPCRCRGPVCNCGNRCGPNETIPIAPPRPPMVLPAPPIGQLAAPRAIQVMLQSVVDSCCQVDEVTREINVPCTLFSQPECLEVGTIIPIELNGDITFREVSRDKDDCNCTSSVRFQIPFSLSPSGGCGGSSSCIERVITVVRSVELCCTKDSMLLAANTKVIAANAWISEICCDCVRICISFLFRSCLQQTIMRQYEIMATPVCEHNNCTEIRNSFVDDCDMVCGCVAGSKSCPSC